jgi:8-oxo-dGTP pyrophosphatase MutT (NUDIX family)
MGLKGRGDRDHMRDSDRLTCNEALHERIRANLQGFEVRSLAGEGLKQAAVALTVVDVADERGVYEIRIDKFPRDDAALILTRRSLKLKNHAGQWALPGGSVDAGEDPEETALRELAEEVGLELPRENVIGRLDDFATRSRFVITPVVVWSGPGVDLTPNPAEVASIHRIPLGEFLREDAPLLEDTVDSKHPILCMPVGESFIAAPTAAFLYQFREVAILGNDTRVVHYDQPFFAWR